MSARGLAPQQVVIPFGVGLNQKMDARALAVPSLTRCLDAAFTEIGGLQTRYPYASIGASIYGGGTVSDCRRIVENGPELLLFTKTALYSWNAQISVWVLKGAHLAAKVAEATKFAGTGDQFDCDRAELNGTIVYTWANGANGYAAAVDKTTGSVLMAPTSIGTGSRLRVVALATKILLTYTDAAGSFYCWALDPAAPATALAGASTVIYDTTASIYYDVVKIPGSDAAAFAGRLNPTTSYVVATITAGLLVTTLVKARTCTHGIAVSCTPDGASIQVIRTSTLNVQGDLVTTSTLVDVYTAQAVGTISAGTVHDVTAAHRSVTDSGVYRCYVFWNRAVGATGVAPGGIKYNWVSSGNTLGTQGLFGSSAYDEQLTLSSRAFDHNGSVYVWAVFDGLSTTGTSPTRVSLQSTYFLQRDDEFLVGKAVGSRAGGFSSSGARLPGVALTNTSGNELTFSWCGTTRRRIPLGGDSDGYAARAPIDISITFDTNEARRCVRLGATLYITGAEILQYDGAGLYEVGFHIYPWSITLTADGPGSGSVPNGELTYKETWRWDNAVGEIDRSTTATYATVTMSGGPGNVTASAVTMTASHKLASGIPAMEVWRTVVNPTTDAPFYLASGKDPGDITAPNQYLDVFYNSVGASLSDEFSDATISSRESNPENGDILESLAPPPATIIAATDTRIFLAGVAGDPHRVWYSRQRQNGEVASFHDALTVDVPRAGGDITAIAARDGVLYVWRETACYALPGDGFDNLGQGQNFGPSRLLSGDVGCVSMEALAATERGFIFKSSKGWYTLEGTQLTYIGAQIIDYDSDTVYAVHVLEGQHQIRVLTSARMLVLDTNVGQWAEWTVSDGLHAAMWNGTYHYLATAAVKAEQTTYTDLTYGWDIETADIPVGNIQGYGRVWGVWILGEHRTSSRIRVRLAKNRATTYFQDKYSAVLAGTAGDPMQIKHGPSTQEMQTIRIRLTANHPTLAATVPTGEALKLSFITLELGVERYLARLPSAQTQ